jgi:hypothetical protein
MPLGGELRGSYVALGDDIEGHGANNNVVMRVGESATYNDWSPMEKVQVVTVLTLAVAILTLVLTRIKISQRARTFWRFFLFISLHIFDYVSNVATMYIVYVENHRKYLWLLAPIHSIIGIFCIYTAATCIDWQNWNCPSFCKFIYLVFLMGFMQGVQVKLAADDFREQRRERNEEESELAVPSMMPARFHLKAMDGVLEGTAFAFVAMYALLKNRWAMHEGFDLSRPHMLALYASAAFSFLTIGLALMEVDYRTSAAIQKKLEPSNMAQVRHMVFRSSEVALRLLTVLAFVTFMRPQETWWWIAFVIVGVDYLLGVILLVVLGGRDPIREAAVLLAVPLFIVNVMQFVDTPGMSLQAQRISAWLVPFRTFELMGVLVYCSLKGTEVLTRVSPTEDPVKKLMWEFLWQDHTEWVVAWAMSGMLYFSMFFAYVRHVKPEADLHVAVANNDVECLKNLCCGELVLDINRYGPDGRTPFHLAALRSKVECMKVLIAEKACVQARTGDQRKNTAVHLAVMNKDTAAIRYLCTLCSNDGPFLNAINCDGDTALHVAARKQNVPALKELLSHRLVDHRIRNKNSMLPVDCAPSDKFGFDRDSSECAITEIFRDAEAGIRPVKEASKDIMFTGSQIGCELSPLQHLDPLLGVVGSGGASSSTAAPIPEDKAQQSQESPSGEELLKTAEEAAKCQNLVPLVAMSTEAEEKFLRRQMERQASGTGSTISLGKRRTPVSPVTNCGISSFMLSAGLGALSRAFLNSIKEDDDAVGIGDQPQVRATFDDFMEMKPIGEGAFGKVILVKHRESGESFAMKLMDKAKFKAQKITSKAVSEQYILKTTRHPFIVALQYAFQGSTFWALVMEYCPNGDLQDVLVNKGTPGLQLRECARLGGEVLLGIGHLHRISVIFRDLKLENVVLDPNMRAKLTDFGLAKKLYTASDARTMCGSYGYAAPEILLNQGRYTYAVDLYSYGVMLYMLLSGGEQAQQNPKQRLPPMRHSSLRRKLKSEGEKDPRTEWAEESIGAHALLMDLTSDNPRDRTTASLLKERFFFTSQLGHPVDDLLTQALAEAEDLRHAAAAENASLPPSAMPPPSATPLS